MLSRKSLDVCSLDAVLLQGTKCAIFVSQSTTTKILSNEFDGGRSVMKSLETEDHGRRGTCNGCKSPYGRCRGVLDLEQMSQERKNSLTSFHIWSHQKSREISSKVLLNPKCPAAGKSWRDWRTRSRACPCGMYNRFSKYKRSSYTLNLSSLLRCLMSRATKSSMVAACTWLRKSASIGMTAVKILNCYSFNNVVHCWSNVASPAFGARYDLLDNASDSPCCFLGL